MHGEIHFHEASKGMLQRIRNQIVANTGERKFSYADLLWNLGINKHLEGVITIVRQSYMRPHYVLEHANGLYFPLFFFEIHVEPGFEFYSQVFKHVWNNF